MVPSILCTRVALGDFEGATEEFAKAMSPGMRRSFDAVRAYGLSFLAMARHQLGHSFQSRRQLDEAAKLARQLLSSSWRTTVQHQVLERESRALIGE